VGVLSPKYFLGTAPSTQIKPSNFQIEPSNFEIKPSNFEIEPSNFGRKCVKFFMFFKEASPMQDNSLIYLFKWWDDTLIALIGIALGIIAKYLYEYTIKYLRAKNKAVVRFDWKGFWLTVLLSGFLAVVMYSGLLSAVAKLENNLLILSVAAQNGFFWQTIIDKLGEEKAKVMLPESLTRKK
jgi:hypothetical protein